MSRISKLPISIPEGVTLTVNASEVSVTGPKGTLKFNLPKQIELKNGDKVTNIHELEEEVGHLGGMVRTMVANMIKGVTEGWSRILELNGTGYRASTSGKELQLALGFSHPVSIPAPEGISFEVRENKITIKGSDKSLVGELAAKIRSLRPADPYKAKGFKYEEEVIIRKAGKAAKGATTGGK